MKSIPTWLALLFSAGSVGWLWFWPEAGQPSKTEATRSLAVSYTIDESVWGGRRPGLCDVARSLGLDLDSRAATMAENAGREACANPRRQYRSGETVRIVVWIPPGSQLGKRCARTCATRVSPTEIESALQP